MVKTRDGARLSVGRNTKLRGSGRQVLATPDHLKGIGLALISHLAHVDAVAVEQTVLIVLLE